MQVKLTCAAHRLLEVGMAGRELEMAGRGGGGRKGGGRDEWRKT